MLQYCRTFGGCTYKVFRVRVGLRVIVSADFLVFWFRVFHRLLSCHGTEKKNVLEKRKRYLDVGGC
ncbi:hypothetical protein Mapa_002248 [Marchantia paleacea]|nr:hypothetical protein Mapa_002248 [Marchantia paleacea]